MRRLSFLSFLLYPLLIFCGDTASEGSSTPHQSFFSANDDTAATLSRTPLIKAEESSELTALIQKCRQSLRGPLSHETQQKKLREKLERKELTTLFALVGDNLLYTGSDWSKLYVEEGVAGFFPNPKIAKDFHTILFEACERWGLSKQSETISVSDDVLRNFFREKLPKACAVKYLALLTNIEEKKAKTFYTQLCAGKNPLIFKNALASMKLVQCKLEETPFVTMVPLQGYCMRYLPTVKEDQLPRVLLFHKGERMQPPIIRLNDSAERGVSVSHFKADGTVYQPYLEQDKAIHQAIIEIFSLEKGKGHYFSIPATQAEWKTLSDVEELAQAPAIRDLLDRLGYVAPKEERAEGTFSSSPQTTQTSKKSRKTRRQVKEHRQEAEEPGATTKYEDLAKFLSALSTGCIANI